MKSLAGPSSLSPLPSGVPKDIWGDLKAWRAQDRASIIFLHLFLVGLPGFTKKVRGSSDLPV